MHKIRAFFLALSIILLPILGFAESSQQKMKNRMKSDLDIIRNALDVDYAPKEWKKLFSGWDLDSEINNAKDKIQNSEQINIKNFQRIIRDFFNTTKDYHVGVYFYSTEKASLPFRVKGAGGKYFITYVDKSRLNATVYPINVGDELVKFDGKPTEQVIREVMEAEMRCSNEATDRGIAEMFLTSRMGMQGHIVPKGPLMISICPKGSDKIATYQLIWKYTPEKITNNMQGLHEDTSSEKPIWKNDFFQKKMLTPLHELISNMHSQGDRSKDLMGSRESYVPPLGKIWWQTDRTSSFYAYLFETEDNRLIGYLRIPHYMGYENEVKEMENIIEFFEQRSDALVIDQVNNPGGLLFYAYALASLLTDEPLYTPRHRMSITQADVAFAVEYIPIFEMINSDADAQELLGDTFFGLPVTHQMSQFFLDNLYFILDQWNAGKTLTDPYFVFGIDKINPHPYTRYKKPILMLINSLDFSCGDFFPAILQDNKRVTLLGTKTAGAGGFVTSIQFPNRYGIQSFSYTGSIAERLDSNPIENLGVTPDIIYEISQEDLKENYKGLVAQIQSALKNIMKKSEECALDTPLSQ